AGCAGARQCPAGSGRKRRPGDSGALKTPGVRAEAVPAGLAGLARRDDEPGAGGGDEAAGVNSGGSSCWRRSQTSVEARTGKRESRGSRGRGRTGEGACRSVVLGAKRLVPSVEGGFVA